MVKKILIIFLLTSFLVLSTISVSNDCKTVVLVGKLAKVQCDITNNDDYVSTKGTGTITFYDSTNKTFAALGHGIKSENQLLEIKNGNIYFSEVSTITKSKNNEVGNLASVPGSDFCLGNITKNNDFGLYGKCNKNISGKEIELANISELKIAPATLYLDFGNNSKKEFDIEIIEIFDNTKNSNSNFKIKITDSDLLEITGGIVKGMSGSPIIQNGKLVGALTKVTSSDVSEGYCIFAETMLDECKNSK